MKTTDSIYKQLPDTLLPWYKQNARALPWRQDTEPYHVWLSEIMLQQTRVEAVIPYFERFIHTYPTLSVLAEAEDDQLHKLWEGLGYYSRVRNMKKCAQVCVERYDGELPRTRDELLKLPGIGPYTAGAIASIACHERVCAVDGNVLRVFSRVLCSTEDIMSARARKHIEQRMMAYLPDETRISAFNQALMDLGATICLPKGEPRCTRCPVQKECMACMRGMQDELPVRSARKPRRIEEHTVLIFVCQGRIKLEKRPPKGLLADLYGFPMRDGKMSEAEVKAAYASGRVISLKQHVHVFTHVEWHMNGFLIESEERDETYHSQAEIERDFALPTAFRPFYQETVCWLSERGRIYEK